MGFFDVVGKVLQSAQQSANKAVYNQAQSNRNLLGGKSVNQWEAQWQYIGRLGSADIGQYREYVGVYKALLAGQLMYIGRAIEYNNGGFRKRLSDYRRQSDSARKHASGKKMNDNADELDIYIIRTGTDAEAAKIASILEKALIGRYDPPWNKQKLF